MATAGATARCAEEFGRRQCRIVLLGRGTKHSPPQHSGANNRKPQPSSGVSPQFFRQHGREKNAVLTPPPAATDRITDRKSTRLNSSHLVISYAVFCLKKKRTEAQ